MLNHYCTTISFTLAHWFLKQKNFRKTCNLLKLFDTKNKNFVTLDYEPVKTCRWTDLQNVRIYYDFFMERKEEF